MKATEGDPEQADYCPHGCHFELDACDTCERAEEKDTGTYRNGHRVYRDGSYREDFGADR